MKSYKKLLLTLLVALCGIGISNAQFRFGVKAGLNINKLHLSDVKQNLDDDNRCGYTLGAMAEFQVPIIGIGVDASLMYTRMNSKVEETVNNEVYTVSNNKNFFEIPVNLKYKIGLPIVGSIVTPYITTGPSFAFKLDKNKDVHVQTKGCQVVWNVGVGVELIKHLQIQGQYGFGVNNIAKHVVDADKVGNVKIRNNYWTVTAAWLF